MSANSSKNHVASLNEIQALIQQSDFQKAQSEAQNALRFLDQALQKVEYYYLLAVCFRMQTRFSDALAALNELILLAPEHARAYQEKGYNYRSLNKLLDASVNFYKATQINPALLSAWQALLPIYTQQKQEEAEALCKRNIDRLSKLPKPILAATDALHSGNIAMADRICRQYLQQNKHSVIALMLLADIALELKYVSEAEFILETCAELEPQNSEAKYELYRVYTKLGKFAKALNLANELVEQDKNNIFYEVAKATSLVGLGELDEAIEIYESILKMHPTKSHVHLLLGHAYKTAGSVDACISAYKNAYTHNQDYGDAFWSLANVKTYTFSAEEVEQMLAATKKDAVSITDKIHMHFALGKAFEDTQAYDTSFYHYKQGNELKNSTLHYSSDEHAGFVQNQIDYFTPELAEQLKDLGCNDKAPIFIVGMPRAGSTLLEQILASHSQVDGTMELHEILGLAANLSKKSNGKVVYPNNMLSIPKDYFKAFGEKFIADTKVYRQGALYFIDKMPNNYMHIGLIKLILPKAKIIDARRDPMACCFSGFKQQFGEGQEFSYSLHNIGRYYQEYVRLMDHWQTVFPGEILQVQHEDMVHNTEAEIRRLLDYCELPFENACLNFHQNKRAVKTPSAQQVRQPIYTSGLKQWEHYAPYLDELKAMFSA